MWSLSISVRFKQNKAIECLLLLYAGIRFIDPVSMSKYGYERLSSGLAPVVRLTEPVSKD